MRKVMVVSFVIFLSISCGNDEEIIQDSTPWFNGVDLSFQLEIEETGFRYKDQEGDDVELLPFLRAKNYNLIRLRLWHTPENPSYNLSEVLGYAKRASALGYGVLLDFHYSDTWADPGKQEIPDGWKNLSFDEMKAEIYRYTRETTLSFIEEGVNVPMVQIGNETNQGFLWDVGRVEGDDGVGWEQYRALTAEAIKAVREVSMESLIMLHYAGVEGADWYFNRVTSLDYDVIGLSYYSRWHSGWSDLQGQMNELVAAYDKDLMIVETAYPWTLGWDDFTNNLWGLEEHLLAGYPATPEGQRDFIQDLISKINNIPNNRGIGFCYWAPDWVAYRGSEASNGSSWENAALFDFEGRALLGVEVTTD